MTPTSHPQPYRSGSRTSVARFEPKMSAATSAPTATTLPATTAPLPDDCRLLNAAPIPCDAVGRALRNSEDHIVVRRGRGADGRARRAVVSARITRAAVMTAPITSRAGTTTAAGAL